MSLKQMQILDSTEAVKQERPAPCARHCEANAFQIVIKNLKAQLAQTEQEPVGVVGTDLGGTHLMYGSQYVGKTPDKKTAIFFKDVPIGAPLYTTPPQRKPLTDEEIILIVAECAASHQHTDIHFARAIERAHGIKELV